MPIVRGEVVLTAARAADRLDARLLGAGFDRPEDCPERSARAVQRVYRLARAGVLPCLRIGRKVLFLESELDAWIATGGKALPGGWRQVDDTGDAL